MVDDDLRTFDLPDVGEGLSEARIERVLVEVGERVSALQPIVEVETDKSVVELTSPWQGEVTQVFVEADVWVDVGEKLLEMRLERD